MSNFYRKDTHTNPDGTDVEYTIEENTEEPAAEVNILKGVRLGQNLMVGGKVTIHGDVGNDVKLYHCCIHQYAMVGDNTSITGGKYHMLTIGEEAIIRTDCHVNGSIGKNSSIGHGCVVSDLPAKSRVGNGSTIQLYLSLDELNAFRGTVWVGESSNFLQVVPVDGDPRGLTSLAIGDNVNAVVRELVGDVVVQKGAQLGNPEKLCQPCGLFDTLVPEYAYIPERHLLTDNSISLVIPMGNHEHVTVLVKEEGESFDFSRTHKTVGLSVLSAFSEMYKTLGERHAERVKTLEGRIRALDNRAKAAA